MTFTRTATSAGSSPASAPTAVADAEADQRRLDREGGHVVDARTTTKSLTHGFLTTSTAIATPTMPATTVATTLSIITAKNTRPAVAPKLRRMPISRMRWRTVTSEMLSRPERAEQQDQDRDPGHQQLDEQQRVLAAERQVVVAVDVGLPVRAERTGDVALDQRRSAGRPARAAPTPRSSGYVCARSSSDAIRSHALVSRNIDG